MSGLDYNDVMSLLENHITANKKSDQLNSKLKNKRIRKYNFPSEISENIVKFFLETKRNESPKWDISVGDLVSGNKVIEVKGFSSVGPTSFGPKEAWDVLYFVDCTKYTEYHFKIYEINLSNKCEAFRNIKITKTQTYGEIADLNQRGKLRISFIKDLKKKLGDVCKCVFDGKFDDLKQKKKTVPKKSCANSNSKIVQIRKKVTQEKKVTKVTKEKSSTDEEIISVAEDDIKLVKLIKQKVKFVETKQKIVKERRIKSKEDIESTVSKPKIVKVRKAV